MALTELPDFTQLVATVRRTPHQYLWPSYDAEAEVLYISFKNPSRATDSELTNDGIIIRYKDDEIIGLTILHATQR